MEILLELVIQLVGEIVLQGLFELGWRGLASPFRAKTTFHPLLALAIYFVLGIASGFIAVWLVPNALIPSPAVRLANLVVSPIVLGFAFELLGRKRDGSGKYRSVFDRFSYGFTFALTFGLVRYVFAG